MKRYFIVSIDVSMQILFDSKIITINSLILILERVRKSVHISDAASLISDLSLVDFQSLCIHLTARYDPLYAVRLFASWKHISILSNVSTIRSFRSFSICMNCHQCVRNSFYALFFSHNIRLLLIFGVCRLLYAALKFSHIHSMHKLPFQVFLWCLSRQTKFTKLDSFGRCHLFDLTLWSWHFCHTHTQWHRHALAFFGFLSKNLILIVFSSTNENDYKYLSTNLCPRCMQAIFSRTHCIHGSVKFHQEEQQKKWNVKCRKCHCYSGGWNWRGISFHSPSLAQATILSCEIVRNLIEYSPAIYCMYIWYTMELGIYISKLMLTEWE